MKLIKLEKWGKTYKPNIKSVIMLSLKGGEGAICHISLDDFSKLKHDLVNCMKPWTIFVFPPSSKFHFNSNLYIPLDLTSQIVCDLRNFAQISLTIITYLGQSLAKSESIMGAILAL